MRNKLKNISRKSTYWLSVAVLGIVVGVSIQFVRAWAPPNDSAPKGDVVAPVLTSGNQTIAGTLTVSNLVIKDKTGTITLGGDAKNKWPEATAAGSAFTPGEWFNDKLVLYSDYNVMKQRTWAPVEGDSFKVASDINRIRLRGSSNQGGYCFAFWGTGHAEITTDLGTVGPYNVDNTLYPIVVGATNVNSGPPTLVDEGFETVSYSCAAYPGAYLGGSTQPICITPTCAAGSTLIYDEYNGSYLCSTPCPFAFNKNGSATLCQADYTGGVMTTLEKEVNIPAGHTIALQGAHVQGPDADYLNCAIDIQYAPK